MWDFLHPPEDVVLRERYALHLTKPSECARELLDGRADLGLIPIAALTPALAIVPGCTIASLARVRSIQLIVKRQFSLEQVRSIATDTASRSSVAYAQIVFRSFIGTNPTFHEAEANAEIMLAHADAALLIGDPALLALERRSAIEANPKVGPCLWIDLAEQWTTRTGLPWVAAVWAACPAAVPDPEARRTLTEDLNRSRRHGLTHIEDLVNEWIPRIALPAETIRSYLTGNIHYSLDERCIEAIQLFRRLATEVGALEPLDSLRFLDL